MQLTHVSHKLLVTGNSGTGKTSYFLDYLRASKHDKVYVFDHEGELAMRLGIPPSYTMEEFSSAHDRQRIIVFDPSQLFPGNTSAAFTFFCDLVFQLAASFGGEKLFACDELQKLIETDVIPWEFSCVLETGRRRGLDAAFISQQPNLIHNRVRSQLTEVVSFQLVDERALNWLLQAGFSEEEIRALPNFHFIAIDLKTGAKVKGVTRPD